MTRHLRTFVASLTSLLLVACGGEQYASITDPGAPQEYEVEEAPLAMACLLGETCPAVTSVLPAVAPKQGPSASTQNTSYWAPDAQAGRNVPRVAKTASLTSLRLERDDVTVWLSSSDDGTGALAADDLLLVEVRSSSGTVLSRQVLAGPRLLLADKTTEVPTRPSTWNAALNGASAPAFDLTPMLPRGRSLTVKVSVFDLAGLTANAPVKLVTRPKVVTPPPVVRAVPDAFDAQARAAQPTASPAELTRFFAPGASTSSDFKAVLVERRRVCNSVTGCTPWEARTHVTLTSSMSVLPELQAMPFRFNLGQTNKGFMATLATASAWNITNVLFFSSNTSGYTTNTCVNAVAQGSYDTCFFFPFQQVKVTADGLWAQSNASSQPYGTGFTEERQFAVVARFDAQQLPVARFENGTWSVGW